MKIHVGDRVRLTGRFLRDTGQMVGGEGRSRWTVIPCSCGLCARTTKPFYVAVDAPNCDDDGFRHINAGNLQKCR